MAGRDLPGRSGLNSRRTALTLGLLAAVPIPARAQAPASTATVEASLAAAMARPALAPFRAEIEAALRKLDDFLKGFNARDIAAYDATFNFPSVRLASNTLTIINPGDHKPDLFARLEDGQWDHSAWLRRDVVHAGPDKVHFDTRFGRYRKDGGLINAYDSLYVLNKQDGRWGIKIRSSYAA